MVIANYEILNDLRKASHVKCYMYMYICVAMTLQFVSGKNNFCHELTRTVCNDLQFRTSLVHLWNSFITIFVVSLIGDLEFNVMT